MGQLLRRIESIHDLAGWHRTAHASLYLIYDPGDVEMAPHIRRIMKGSGDPVLVGGYGAQPMLAPRHMARAAEKGVSAPEAIRSFAMNIAFADLDALRENPDPDHEDYSLLLLHEMLKEPAILGFAACSESYGMVTPPGTKIDRHANSLDKHPGARPNRFVIMVDIEDRMHMVTRQQGGYPAKMFMSMRDPGGYIVDSLRMLSDLAGGRLPTNQAEFDARYDREIP